MSAHATLSGLKPRRVDLGTTENLRLSLLTDPPGIVESPGSDRLCVCIHAGAPVFALCRHGKERHHGTVIYGDIDIIPPDTPASWELKGKDVDLVIGIKQEFLRAIASDSGRDASDLEFRSRFQVRDSQLEHIGWALKSEMESGYPSGRLYLDSLATAFAARILANHSSLSRLPNGHDGKMSHRKLREVLCFIEENLGRHIPLFQLAAISGLSVSHFKVLFRRSVGLSAHQYLIRRRIERAEALLLHSRLPIGQVALEVGFCHQSHLAMHMRRILGVLPREVRQTAD